MRHQTDHTEKYSYDRVMASSWIWQTCSNISINFLWKPTKAGYYKTYFQYVLGLSIDYVMFLYSIQFISFLIYLFTLDGTACLCAVWCMGSNIPATDPLNRNPLYNTFWRGDCHCITIWQQFYLEIYYVYIILCFLYVTSLWIFPCRFTSLYFLALCKALNLIFSVNHTW